VPTSFVYDDSADFLTWSGSRRVRSGVMRLAFKDSSAFIGTNLAGISLHYRWGTLQSHINSPDDGRSAIASPTSGDVAFTDDGIAADSEGGHLLVPSPQSAFKYLYEPDNATPVPVPPASIGVVDSMWMASWVKVDAASFGVIFGGHFVADPEGVAEGQFATCSLGVITRLGRTYFVLSMQRREHGGDGGRLLSQCDVTSLEGRWAHVGVHAFYRKDNTARYIHIRWFINGQFVSEETGSIDSFGSLFRSDGALQLFQSDAIAPSILAARRSVPDWSSFEPWGDTEIVYQYQSEIDEFLLAFCHPIEAEGGGPLVSQSWDLLEEVFVASRHPDPSHDSIESDQFILLSPVINSGAGAGTAIVAAKITFTFPTIATGQFLAFATRASGTTFDPTDPTVPWTEWRIVNVSESGVKIDWHGEGLGDYVQIRLRLLPSADGRALYSPAISRVEVEVDTSNWVAGSLSVPCEFTVIPYMDVPSQILVYTSGHLDVPCELPITAQGTPLNVPCELVVMASLGVPCEITIYSYLGVPCEIVIYDPATTVAGTFDVPCEIAVTSPEWVPGSFDVSCEIVIRARLDVPAEIQVLTFTVPCEISVQRAGQIDVPCEVDVPPETPGGVDPLNADVVEGAWQPQSLIHFSWGSASWATSPVVAYHWRVDRTAASAASGTWAATATTHAAVELNSGAYGGGTWYIHVAAKNALGYFGPTSHYQVRWNRPPGRPGGFMAVNGQDTLAAVPVAPSRGSPVFTWGPSDDPDGGLPEYQVQFSTRPDFAIDPGTGQSSIIFQVTRPINSWTMGQAFGLGLFFWRVRANDGYELSDWSPIGAFRLNKPPNRPRDLVVRQP